MYSIVHKLLTKRDFHLRLYEFLTSHASSSSQLYILCVAIVHCPWIWDQRIDSFRMIIFLRERSFFFWRRELFVFDLYVYIAGVRSSFRCTAAITFVCQLVRKIIVYYSTIELYLIAPSALVAQINQLNSITYIDTKSKFIQFLSPLISTTIFIYVHVVFIIIFNH